MRMRIHAWLLFKNDLNLFCRVQNLLNFLAISGWFSAHIRFTWCDFTRDFAVATSLVSHKEAWESCGTRCRSCEFGSKRAPCESGFRVDILKQMCVLLECKKKIKKIIKNKKRTQDVTIFETLIFLQADKNVEQIWPIRTRKRIRSKRR